MLFTMSCRNDNLSEFSYKENGQSSDNISFDKDVTYNFNTKNSYTILFGMINQQKQEAQ